MTTRTDTTEDFELLDTTQVAEVLGMGRDWVRRQCKAGQIPAKKYGRDWKVTRANLRAFIAGGTGAVPAAQGGRKLTARQKKRAT